MAPVHRLFFAVRPPELERLLLGCVRDSRSELESRVSNDRLHGTIAITPDFDGFPESLARHMIAIAGTVFATSGDIILDRLSGSARSLAMRPTRQSPGIMDLASQLQRPMMRSGILRPEWEFNLHFTLGYRDGRPFSARVDPIGWHCREFVLIHSIVGRTRHIELGRWPLVPRQYRLFD